jgi:hypothetical protein
MPKALILAPTARLHCLCDLTRERRKHAGCTAVSLTLKPKRACATHVLPRYVENPAGGRGRKPTITALASAKNTSGKIVETWVSAMRAAVSIIESC